MTQAGLLLLFSCLALSMALFSRTRWRILWAGSLLLSLISLALTMTRGAWVGFGVALCFILFLYKPKALILVPVVAGLLFAAAPQTVKQRALSIFSLNAFSNRQRVEYIKAGIKIIKDYPLLGTGSDTVDMVFQNPKYNLSEDAKRNVHLHNNFIQIAAERGLPTLAAWLAFLVWAFLSLFRMLKNRSPSSYALTAAALAALLALVSSGAFEYNFADSEIAMLFFFILTVPFARVRVQEIEKRGPG
jgi:O-antigen ligase